MWQYLVDVDIQRYHYYQVQSSPQVYFHLHSKHISQCVPNSFSKVTSQNYNNLKKKWDLSNLQKCDLKI